MRDARWRELLDGVHAAQVVEALTPYVTERRRSRIGEVVASRMHGVEVCLERPYDPHNAAAVVRSAEITGAGRVHVVEASERILKAKRTTTGAFHWVETTQHQGVEHLVEDTRSMGMLLAGACVDGDVDLESLPVDAPICLVFGNEHAGLSDTAKAAVDLRFSIAMHGFSESFNLSVSAAISLYSVTRRRRAVLGSAGDLDAEAREELTARYYAASVDRRLVRAVIEGLQEAPSDG